MFTFNGYKHQGHSICSRNPPSKFVIGAFFRLITVTLTFCETSNLPFLVIFFFVYVIYYENCWEMFTFNGYKHQGHSICSQKPPSKFVIGAFFRLICRFRSFFFLFMSIIMKTVGNCSLLTVISIKEIRFAVENHPQSLFAVFGPFFLVYVNYYENCWELFTFNGYEHQGQSICCRKPPSKFVIGVFFRLFGRFRWLFFCLFNYYETVGKCFLTVISIKGHSICSRKPPSMFVIVAFFRLVMLYKETKKKISEIYK
ncbi:hypothetical protein AGLY_016963 [Aphis glycines]|uniref:Uncharacterized protein n=1 Tax=Aphis glycines TaxID=307491 RepID=A0A6G0SWV9_APHGL|nr:hypothetical protein AGLY_016963 [Aphis glycines]